jgi:hypothetical protein
LSDPQLFQSYEVLRTNIFHVFINTVEGLMSLEKRMGACDGGAVGAEQEYIVQGRRCNPSMAVGS